MIREMEAADWPDVKRIYEEGIKTKNATFETEAPSYEVWDKSHFPKCRFVYVEEGGKVDGWIALSPISDRCVYGGVAEVTVYVSKTHQGNGVGFRLYKKFIPATETLGIWTLQAGIFPENQASVKLHQKVGFRIVGVREKLGQMDGDWRDVLLMERRSRKF